MSDHRLAILRELQEAPGPLSCEELTVRLPYSNGAVYSCLLQLELDGLIRGCQPSGDAPTPSRWTVKNPPS